MVRCHFCGGQAPLTGTSGQFITWRCSQCQSKGSIHAPSMRDSFAIEPNHAHGVPSGSFNDECPPKVY